MQCSISLWDSAFLPGTAAHFTQGPCKNETKERAFPFLAARLWCRWCTTGTALFCWERTSLWKFENWCFPGHHSAPHQLSIRQGGGEVLKGWIWKWREREEGQSPTKDAVTWYGATFQLQSGLRDTIQLMSEFDLMLIYIYICRYLHI